MLAILARVLFLLTGRCENGLFAIPLSYRELAEFAQTTPETLSRTLRDLQNKGIIKVEKNGLRVMQAEALKEFLEGHD